MKCHPQNFGVWAYRVLATQLFQCCTAVFRLLQRSFWSKMTSALQKSQCCSATSAAQHSENCSATSVFTCGTLQGRYPPIARYGVFGVSTWPIGCDTPSRFSERFPLWRACKEGISAILARYPMKTRQYGSAIPPAAIPYLRKGIARYGGVKITHTLVPLSATKSSRSHLSMCDAIFESVSHPRKSPLF